MDRRPAANGGFTLIEALVSLTIFSVVLIALSGLMLHVGIQTRRSASYAYRSAAAQEASVWVEGLPWDSLDTVSGLGCTTDSTGFLVYDRCTTVADTLGLKRVTVVITPTDTTLRPDTLVMDRARPRAPAPF
jgi:prepilin-type N-terminal cleavage/methylation domain-containing protein